MTGRLRDADRKAEPPGLTWGLAVAGFLAAATSMLLPWWRITLDQEGERVSTTGIGLFRPLEPVTTTWGPHVTGAVVAVVAVLLFIRIAGQSWAYEPAAWRRDLWIAAALMAIALASTMLWPQSLDYFWGGREAFDNATGSTFSERAGPGLGWWVGGLASALLAAAGRILPAGADTSGK